MNPPNAILPTVYLARHGETAWSLTGQHTGLTDLPLTEHGERNAGHLGERLRGLKFAKVFTSPLQRASRTCELAGFKAAAEIDKDLVEWNYGAYEGLTTPQIQSDRPGWNLWNDGVPNGETVDQVAARAGSAIERALACEGDVALFSHGHALRILTACWLGLPPDSGRLFALGTASLSTLGYERATRVITRWNLSLAAGSPGMLVI